MLRRRRAARVEVNARVSSSGRDCRAIRGGLARAATWSAGRWVLNSRLGAEDASKDVPVGAPSNDAARGRADARGRLERRAELADARGDGASYRNGATSRLQENARVDVG